MPEYHQTNQLNSLSTNKPINNNCENLYNTNKPITQASNQSGSTNSSRQQVHDTNMNLVNQLGNYINNFNSYTNQSYSQQQSQQYNLQTQAPQYRDCGTDGGRGSVRRRRTMYGAVGAAWRECAKEVWGKERGRNPLSYQCVGTPQRGGMG